MRKTLFGLMSATMLFAASCTNEVELLNEGGKTATVSFKVETPEIVSRTYSDGSKATKLQYAVYNAEGEILSDLTVTNGTINGSTTVSLNLASGKDYSVIFWAAATDAPYTVDFTNKEMTVDYTAAKSNDENRDAFYAYQEFTVNGANTQTIQLKRPFAQLNIGTNDYAAAATAGFNPTFSKVTVENVYSTLNLATGTVGGEVGATFDYAAIAGKEGILSETFPVTGYDYLAMNYLLVGADKSVVDITFSYAEDEYGAKKETRTVGSVPVQRNYRTNIYGKLLTGQTDINVEIKPGYEDDDKYGEINGQVYAKVANSEEFNSAFADENIDVVILQENIALNETLSRSVADPTLTLENGKTLIIDLNGKTLSATSTQSSRNYDMILVKGNLTVKNGTITTEHTGTNMGWGAMTTIFDVTAGGVLNLEGVTAKNLGGSDMGFVAHLNNWGEVTLNVENSTLESNYVAVRVFNSGNDMNNVTIKNSTLKGVSAAFWVHNYTVADFGSEAKAEAQKALLNLNIYDQGNTFSPDVNGIRYGFTNSVRTDAKGITKTVSEDGTEVTLGSLVEDGVVRRGVAGAEENSTIKKVVVEEGVTTLYDRTFRRFYGLETVELPSTLTTIGAAGNGVFQSCTALKNIVIPESVTVLGEGTFQECSSLESINIPAGVTRIEANTLRATGLVSVEFHAGVTYFGAQAFRDCKQLKEVVINAPEFTVEANAFGVMAGTLPGTTIYVANAEMKAYLESTLAYKNQFTIVAPETETSNLQTSLKAGENVVLFNDLTIAPAEMVAAPYGNKTGFIHNGGVFNGNGKTISVTAGGDNYAVMTSGGTIKNLTVDNGFRGIVIMSATQTVYLDNVVSSGNVCYALNTAEGNSSQDLVATNCTFNGWSSWSLLKSATFTNCTFGQGEYYTNVYGRLGKPYVDTLFEGCEFCSKFYIDLSSLGDGQKVTLKNCSVNGVKLTAQNWGNFVAPESTCGEGQISIELKNGTYMTAENVADYIIFE